MRRALKLVQLLSLLLLSGCAFINSFNSDLDKQVDTWMAQHEYAKVIDTLKYVRPSNPKYNLLQRKRKQAVIDARRYQQSQINLSLAQIEKGQWHKADLTLKNAMDKLPKSPKLDKTYQEFVAQRKQYLRSLYIQIAINTAEWLSKNKDIELQLKHTQPDSSQVQDTLSRFQNETQQVYPKLLRYGKLAESLGDFGLAQQCYELANRLSPSAALKQKLAKIRATLDKQLPPSKPPGKSTPKLSLLGKNLLEKSRQALQAGNLKLALNHYEKIPDDDKQLPVVRQYSREMEHRIRENVHQGIELGRKLYSQGQVEQALAVWNKLRDLDPDNENLLSHIDRAQRVMQKIRQLRKEQKQGNSVQSGVSNP